MDIMFTVKCKFLSSLDVFAITVYTCVCRCDGVCVCVWSQNCTVAFHAVHELYKSISRGQSRRTATSSRLASADSCTRSISLPPTQPHLHTHRSKDGTSSELVDIHSTAYWQSLAPAVPPAEVFKGKYRFHRSLTNTAFRLLLLKPNLKIMTTSFILYLQDV